MAIATIIIFFALQFPKNGNIGLNTIQTWWGNSVYLNTVDANGTPLLPLPDKGYFGFVRTRPLGAVMLTCLQPGLVVDLYDLNDSTLRAVNELSWVCGGIGQLCTNIIRKLITSLPITRHPRTSHSSSLVADISPTCLRDTVTVDGIR